MKAPDSGSGSALMTTRIDLYDANFERLERPLCRFGEIAVSTFRYDSSIAALRISNARGQIIVLPFKGQQIWRASFDQRDLTMRSMFDEPVDTRDYLATYGAFFNHCGLTGLGAPGPDDNHPLHGELPNAPMKTAWLEIDEASGAVTLWGTYQHTIAFATNYLATIKTTLTAGSALLDLSVSVENLKQTPMDLMYLGHGNFRPVDNAQLHYTAAYDASSVRVRRSIPSHVTPAPGYADFLAELADTPTAHHSLTPGLAFDPEVVFEIDMKADADGVAHALHAHPDGCADYVSFRPDQAPLCMRWICRTPDQDGLGLAFPATSGVEGHGAEKAKGRVVTLAGGAVWQLGMKIGALSAAEATHTLAHIQAIREA